MDMIGVLLAWVAIFFIGYKILGWLSSLGSPPKRQTPSSRPTMKPTETVYTPTSVKKESTAVPNFPPFPEPPEYITIPENLDAVVALAKGSNADAIYQAASALYAKKDYSSALLLLANTTGTKFQLLIGVTRDRLSSQRILNLPADTPEKLFKEYADESKNLRRQSIQELSILNQDAQYFSSSKDKIEEYIFVSAINTLASTLFFGEDNVIPPSPFQGEQLLDRAINTVTDQRLKNFLIGQKLRLPVLLRRCEDDDD